MSQQTRDKLVRDLTPAEAGALLVHAHIISEERRNALLFLRGPANAYFDEAKQAEIKAWIEKEDYLPQDSEYDHPKRATHWCNYCGHVESCEHDQAPKLEVREKRLCEACDQQPATYVVELRDLENNVHGSEFVCRGCLPIVAPALVGAADFAKG